MKLAVLGPGALGCLLAALLREAGADVSLVDYRPERVARLRLRGIQMYSLDGGHRLFGQSYGSARRVRLEHPTQLPPLPGAGWLGQDLRGWELAV